MTGKQAPGPRELQLRAQREERWARGQAQIKAAAAQEAAAKPIAAASAPKKVPKKRVRKSGRNRASSEIGRSRGYRKKP